MAAVEMEEWDIGPYCDDTSCRIPYGVGVGNNDMPMNVLVSFPKSQITEIDVSFNATFWMTLSSSSSRKTSSLRIGRLPPLPQQPTYD